MRKLVVAMLVVLGLPVGQAAAQCSGSPVAKSVLDGFAGNTICGRPGPAYTGPDTDRWQEEHILGGDLFDYKLGPSSKLDPREKVGTWTTTAGSPATITHNYNGGGSYTYSVYLNSGVYSFCSGTSEVIRAQLQNGTAAACAAYPAAAAAPVTGSRKR
jgi:hypothetical protein